MTIGKFDDKEQLLLKIAEYLNNYITESGIKDSGSKDDISTIYKYILQYFKHLSLQDIKLAFEYTIVKKINIEHNHYGKLSVDHIMAILNCYSNYKREISKGKAGKEIELWDNKPFNNFESDKEKYKVLIDAFIYAIERYRKNEVIITPDINKIAIYDMLKVHGLTLLSDQERNYILNQAHLKTNNQVKKQANLNSKAIIGSVIQQMFQANTNENISNQDINKAKILSFKHIMLKYININSDLEVIKNNLLIKILSAE